MSDTQNSSFSLLNQKEIDSLIGFLSEQKNSLNSDVLSQTSIDKLIKLISSDSDRIITDVFDPFAHVDNSVLATLGFREDVSQLCELKFAVDESNDYIILTAYNTVTKKELIITPNLINANDTKDWGCSISPVFFNRIAKVFSFKYMMLYATALQSIHTVMHIIRFLKSISLSMKSFWSAYYNF